jgi:hypothetical protein
MNLLEKHKKELNDEGEAATSAPPARSSPCARFGGSAGGGKCW